VASVRCEIKTADLVDLSLRRMGPELRFHSVMVLDISSAYCAMNNSVGCRVELEDGVLYQVGRASISAFWILRVYSLITRLQSWSLYCES
jgi:hypothetical protein